MKEFLQVVLVPCMLFALAGCAAAPVSSFPAPSSSETVSPSSSAEAPRPTPEDPDEARLLGLLQEAAGREMMRHLYLDMDQDGEAELLGVCLNTDVHLYEVWYCSSDGQTCTLAEQDKESMESCFLDPLVLEGEIRCLVSWQPGAASMTEEGDLLLTTLAHDAFYDPAVGGLIGLGEKQSYLFYQNGAYGEYGATELTQEEFNALQGASELMSAIEHELRFEDVERMDCRYFLRANGILQVQCDLYRADGGVEYGYFTARCQDGTVDPALIGPFTNGQLESPLTTLEVVY